MAGSSVEEIKARLDVAEVVSPYVALKRSGRSYKGLCPFHGEKTPSFYVFPETGTWKCFGCGEGGDVFTFLQKRENLEFGEALRMLASKAGLELRAHEARSPEAAAAEDRLRGALGAAEMYFRAALRGKSGSGARDYLHARAIGDETIERFGLGFAPNSGLSRHLQEAGYSEEEAVEVGLVGRRDDGSRYELFRERVVFPIRDPSGRMIGFGGRTLGEAQPKYLNGPQTRFFDKSGSLFALDLARSSIRQSGQAVVVEGYFDVIMAHQSGYANVVATLGTSLTERHLDLLGRRAAEIILALDADAAGQAATLRGQKLAEDAPADTLVPVPDPPERDQVVKALSNQRFFEPDSRARGWVRFQAVRRSQIKIASLPDGLDPDDLVRRDPSEWGRLVQGAMPVVDFLLSRLGKRHDLATATGKRDAVQEAMQVIRDLTDPVEQAHYLQRLAAIVGLDESGLRMALRRVGRRSMGPSAAGEPEESHELPESYALALFFLSGAVGDFLTDRDLPSPEGRAIYALISTLPPERQHSMLTALADTADPNLRQGLLEVAAWVRRLANLPREQLARELEVVALKLRQRQLRLRHQEVLAMLSELETSESEEGPVVPARMLSAIAAQLKEIETALARRDGIGSLVWRSRRVGEVLGG